MPLLRTVLRIARPLPLDARSPPPREQVAQTW